MHVKKKEVIAPKLANLTNKMVTIYDKGTGDIVSILPVISELPEQPPAEPYIYYIVNKKTANRLKHSGRSLKDIAILHPVPFLGYRDTSLNYLLWGEDINTEVCYVPSHHL